MALQTKAVSRNVAKAAEKRFRACKEVSGLANGNLETLRKDMWRGFARQGCVQKCGQSRGEAFPGLQRGFRPGKRQSRNAKKGHVTGLCKARLCPEMRPKLPRAFPGLQRAFRPGKRQFRNTKMMGLCKARLFRACKEVSGLAHGNLETLRKDMWRGFARQGCVQKR